MTSDNRQFETQPNFTETNWLLSVSPMQNIYAYSVICFLSRMYIVSLAISLHRQKNGIMIKASEETRHEAGCNEE